MFSLVIPSTGKALISEPIASSSNRYTGPFILSSKDATYDGIIKLPSSVEKILHRLEDAVFDEGTPPR